MVRYRGKLCVYRESSVSSYLSASLTIGPETFHWKRAPKCFDDVIVNGHNNLVIIDVDLNDQMKNPRNVTLIEVVPRK